jgi:hypothetical protein
MSADKAHAHAMLITPSTVNTINVCGKTPKHIPHATMIAKMTKVGSRPPHRSAARPAKNCTIDAAISVNDV